MHMYVCMYEYVYVCVLYIYMMYVYVCMLVMYLSMYEGLFTYNVCT